ncbi:hypothetical protein [Parasphingorhabdus sp.]|uniref:hypothetical protein n=1 Tax=Parasphingorhabdus sp. TaxID=2709688 RepID=UPI002B26A6E3|nr:hypothetical protein [Parasphingorhabdus sp.]
MSNWRKRIGSAGNIAVARAQKLTAFWNARSLFLNLLFRIDRLSSSLQRDAETISYTGSVYRELFSISLKGIIASALFIFICEMLESLVSPIVAKLTPDLISISPDASDFLALIGQIGAIFLGVYFATFGIILSSSYSRVRNDVVDLILREKVNNIYSSYLINLTILCLISVGLSFLGYQTGYTIFFTVLIGGLIAILCIFELGKRLFLFFDVTRLVDAEILPEVTRLIAEVASSGRRSIHLDAHRQKIVSQRIATLRYLSFNSSKTLAQSSKPNSRVDFAYATLLRFYASERSKIPQDSYWFKRTSKHPEWFFENDSSTSMALQTDMHLLPKEEINVRWFEEELLDGLLASFEECLKQGDYSAAHKSLQYAQSANEALAAQLLPDEGFSFLERFSVCIRDNEKAPELPLADATAKSRFEKISLHLGMAHASYMFGYEYLRSAILFAKKLPNCTNKIDWKKPNFGDFPSPLLERMQSTKIRVEFETTVEGRTLMPPSYITQLIAKDFTAATSKGIDRLLMDMKRTTTEAVASFVAEKREYIATPILLSSFRSVTQFSHFIDLLDKNLDAIYALQIYPEYEIIKVDTERAKAEFADLRSELLSALCSMPIISFLAGDLGEAEELPDYFGHSYFMLAEECFKACKENDSDRFKKLFLGFGILAQLAFSRFNDKKGQVSDEYFLSLLGTIAEDMLALTGYALVFAEIHENADLKSHANDVWERLLDNAQDRQVHLRWIIQISSALKASFFGAPRNLIRTEWSMQLERALREMGFDDGMDFGRAGRQHPSPIVRSVAGIGMSQPSEAGVYLLLLDKIEGEFELPRSVENFKASYDREVTRG